MQSILNNIAVMGVDQGPVLFHTTAKVMVQALRKGKTCNGKTWEVKSCNANACKGTACAGKVS
jgi:hypothetical protein